MSFDLPLVFDGIPGFDTSIVTDTDRFSLWAPTSKLLKPKRAELVTSATAEEVASAVVEGVSKGNKARGKLGRIVGIANSEIPDEDTDEIDQSGLEWDYFVGKGPGKPGHGLIIFEHPVGVLNTIGYPVKTELVEITSPTTGKLVKATRVEADLYLDDKLGRRVWRKALTMKRAGGQRRLGFSIEGSVLMRKGRKVLKARVKWLAITAAPRNHDSWWEPFMKSVLAQSLLKSGVGYPTQGMPSSGAIAPLVAQSIQGGVVQPDRDALVMKIAKSWPQTLTWSQAERVFDELTKFLTAKGYDVRIT